MNDIPCEPYVDKLGQTHNSIPCIDVMEQESSEDICCTKCDKPITKHEFKDDHFHLCQYEDYKNVGYNSTNSSIWMNWINSKNK